MKQYEKYLKIYARRYRKLCRKHSLYVLSERRKYGYLIEPKPNYLKRAFRMN